MTDNTPTPAPDEITPNVVISNPATRRRLGIALYIVSIITGIATLFFLFFPEAALGTDLPERVIAFVTAVVTLLSGAFGLTVTTPNVPKV